MRVLLISANTETITTPTLPLGLACVAAATRHAGNEVALLNLMFEEDPKLSIKTSLEDFRPDLIGISVRNIDDQRMVQPQFMLAPVRKVIASCRSLSDAPIVLGGAGYSIFPQSALGYLGADMGIQGEGEVIFPLLVERVGESVQVSDLPGIHLPQNSYEIDSPPPKEEGAGVVAHSSTTPPPSLGVGPKGSTTPDPSLIRRGIARRIFVHSGEPPQRYYEKNLDHLPLPDPRLWIPHGADLRNLWVPVQSRRGCSLDCTFCSTSLIEGKSLRTRSPAKVVEWLAKLRETGCRNVNFVDNTFNLPPDYAKDLCRQVIQAGLDLNLWCIVYPKWIDAELVQLMKHAGCSQISFGFESGSDRVLRSLNKQFDKNEISAAAKMFAEAGIERMGFLMLGGPGETKESVEESLVFAGSLHLEALKITVGLRIYPQTPLATTALAEGVIGAGDDLLLPRFYLLPELRDWLPERVAAYRASRPWVS